MRILYGCLALLLVFNLAALADENTDAAKTVVTGAYPIDYCIVSGEKLGSMGEPVVKAYDGREVKFCCPACPPKFEADKAKYLAKLDKAVAAAQRESYPIETCVVSGEALGSMGEPVELVHQNKLIRLCCAGCINTFKSDPEKYLDKAYGTGGSGTETGSHDGHSH